MSTANKNNDLVIKSNPVILKADKLDELSNKLLLKILEKELTAIVMKKGVLNER